MCNLRIPDSGAGIWSGGGGVQTRFQPMLKAFCVKPQTVNASSILLFSQASVRDSGLRFWNPDSIHGKLPTTQMFFAGGLTYAQSTLGCTGQIQANGTCCCCEWECSHWMQTPSEELPANLRARVQCDMGLEYLSVLFASVI